MKRFKQYFYEGMPRYKFNKTKNIIHLMDIPMFSIYVNKKDIETWEILNSKVDVKAKLKKAFELAKNYINKLGFPSEHTNILIDDAIMKKFNYSGLAHSNGYMVIDTTGVVISYLYSNNPKHFVNTIVHEWAHLWLWRRSKSFKNALEKIYKTLITKTKKDTQGGYHKKRPLITDKNFRIFLNNSINWVSEYGLQNVDEFWATGIADFFKLDYKYRRLLINYILNN